MFYLAQVVVSAPVKEENVLNIVYGVNHSQYNSAKDHIVTAASCTTNCLAPIVKVRSSAFMFLWMPVLSCEGSQCVQGAALLEENSF